MACCNSRRDISGVIDNKLIECCDPDGVRHLVQNSNRNRFWPGFSHPRWLECDVVFDRSCNGNYIDGLRRFAGTERRRRRCR